MSKAVITVICVAIMGALVSLEYVLYPDRSLPVFGSRELNEQGQTSPYQKKQTYKVPTSQINLGNIKIASIQDIYTKPSNPISHIFGAVRFDAEIDGIQVLKTDIADTESDRVLVSVYEIFPVQDSTVSRLFSFVKQKFEASFVNDPETHVQQTDQFGLHSFYFNPSQSPEKAFLLIAKENRVLGFEYLKVNHELLLPFFQSL